VISVAAEESVLYQLVDCFKLSPSFSNFKKKGPLGLAYLVLMKADLVLLE